MLTNIKKIVALLFYVKMYFGLRIDLNFVSYWPVSHSAKIGQKLYINFPFQITELSVAEIVRCEWRISLKFQ